MSRCHAQRRQVGSLQRGFTLIELLVALGVSAFIAVMSYQAINSMVNVKSSVDSHMAKMEDWQRAVWRMQQDLVQLAPRTIQDQLGSALPAFQYREDMGLEFSRIAQYPTMDSTAGLARVGYQYVNGTLYRLSWPVMDRAQDTEVKRVELLKEVTAFEVTLLDDQDKWQKSWPPAGVANSALPMATRVVIEHSEYGTINRLFMGAN